MALLILQHLLAALLFAAGHLVRDGYPDLNSLTGGVAGSATKRGLLGTQAARALGGLLCGLGVLAVWGVGGAALALWIAVWAGFYVDQHHAAGQSAQTWRDAEDLDISGETSVFLPAAVFFCMGEFTLALALIAVGFLKAPLWFGAFRFCSQAPGTWALPTRVAAMAFGALIGLVV